MPVEQIAVGLGTSSHYDTVSATIRGKTVPENGQNFTVDLASTVVNFEIEDVEKTPRSGAESSYSVSGRELRSEFLYRAVDFYMSMPYNTTEGAFSLPYASEIVGALGLSVVYDAPDFRPTVAGMGWKTEYTKYTNGSYSSVVRIREKNVQALLDKLFAWTSEFGKRKICWHVRQGTLYIWELQRATGQSMTVTLDMCPKDKLKIKKSRIRKFSEVTDTSSSSVSTPASAMQIAWDYADRPFSGSFSLGEAQLTYSDGYLIRSVKASTGQTQTETYTYGTYWGATCLASKEVKTEVTSDDSNTTTTKTVTTTYDYSWERAGSTTGSGRAVPVLCSELTVNTSTTSDSNETTETERTKVEYSPLGNGFYGITATRYVNGKVDQVQTSVSKDSPGGAASQYTNRVCTGWHTVDNGTGASSFPGYVLAPTRLPIESSDLVSEYLTEFVNLHGAIEQTITAEVVGQAALNPIQGKIVHDGVEYYATEASINWTSNSRRMSVAGIRWDYDFTYRKNILGYDEDD